jgi:hypothetical protein
MGDCPAERPTAGLPRPFAFLDVSQAVFEAIGARMAHALGENG